MAGQGTPLLEAITSGDTPAPRVTKAGVRGFVVTGGPGSANYMEGAPPPAPDNEIAGAYDPNSDFVHKTDPSQQPDQPAVGVEGPVSVAPVRAAKRISVYTARNDLFSVQVEEAPDYDPVEGFKPLRLNAESVVEVIEPLCTALGIKFIDRTGGDLEELYEADHPKPAGLETARSRKRGAS